MILAAIKSLHTPIRLSHSTTDLPYIQSERIYANSNPAQTGLYLSRWGAPHGRAHSINRTEYTQRVDEFLAAKVPTFGLPRQPRIATQ